MTIEEFSLNTQQTFGWLALIGGAIVGVVAAVGAFVNWIAWRRDPRRRYLARLAQIRRDAGTPPPTWADPAPKNNPRA